MLIFCSLRVKYAVLIYCWCFDDIYKRLIVSWYSLQRLQWQWLEWQSVIVTLANPQGYHCNPRVKGWKKSSIKSKKSKNPNPLSKDWKSSILNLSGEDWKSPVKSSIQSSRLKPYYTRRMICGTMGKFREDNFIRSVVDYRNAFRS